jgi:hypothetical protein
VKEQARTEPARWRRRLWARAGAAGLVGLAGGALAGGWRAPAGADLPVDALSVSSPGAVNAGNLAGGDNTGIAVGPLVITDTLDDTTPTAWTVSVAASNCGPTSSTLALPQFSGLQAAAVIVPATQLTFVPGALTLVSGLGTAETTPVPGPTATFSAVGAGGFSSPITVATGPPGATTLDNNGQWSQGASLNIDLTRQLTVAGAYSCTLQYTVTG